MNLRQVRTLSHLLIALLLLAALLPVQAARANVTLVSFTATPGDGQVTLNWETATEIDTVGFFIRRSLEEDGLYTRVSDFIPAQGDSLTGATYEYVDSGLNGGTTYYYKLEAIDSDQTVEFFGPIDATPTGASASPTPTNTSQAATPTHTATSGTPGETPTATSGATGETPTVTPTHTHTTTPTRTPTSTHTPTHTPTPRPYYSPTPTFTPSLTPTITPTPTREFFSPASPTPPQSTQTPDGYPAPVTTLTITSSGPVSPTTMLITSSNPTPASIVPAMPTAQTTPNWLSSRGFAIGLIVLLWLLLAAWLVYFIAKISS